MARPFKQYEQKTLKKIQQIELDILKDIIEICNNHNIEYFISFGTALGAVRHGGFIPWDDDIDISMMRKDFEKFKIIYEKELSQKYNLVNSLRCPGWDSTVTHLELKGTKFVAEEALKMPYKAGIYVDIFIIDKIPSNKLARSLHYKKTWVLQNLMILASDVDIHLPYSGITKTLASFICKLSRKFLKIIHTNTGKIYTKLQRLAMKNINNKSNYYTHHECSDMRQNTCEIKDIYPLQKIKFEDIEVNIINNYDKNLSSLFGDYMKMPPPELRYNHKPAIIDFGKY